MALSTLFLALKIILVSSIFFVWVVRYENIVKEFNEYNFPHWFRDFIGILKLSFCGILISGNTELIKFASGGMAFLMAAAFFVHVKFNHKWLQMVPSLSLLMICSALFLWG